MNELDYAAHEPELLNQYFGKVLIDILKPEDLVFYQNIKNVVLNGSPIFHAAALKETGPFIS